MKTFLTIVFLCNLILSAQPKIDTKWIYFNTDKFQIQYPDNCSIDTSKNLGADLFIFLNVPLEDAFKTNLNIAIQPLKDPSINIEKYKIISEKQFEELPEYKIKTIESKIVSNAANPYYIVNYFMEYNSNLLKIYSKIYISNHKAYIITYTSSEDLYSKYFSIGQNIINSFKIKH